MGRKKDFLIVLFLLILSLIFFWKVIFLGKVLLPFDILSRFLPWYFYIKVDSIQNYIHTDALMQFYPYWSFWAETIKSGNLPLWNPYILCGTPFLANPQSQTIYPLNLFFSFLSIYKAFSYFIILHIFLAALFMYLYLKEISINRFASLIGAIIFVFSGFLIVWLEFPPVLCTSIWIPLIFFLTERTIKRKNLFYPFLTSIVLSIQYLAGHSQFFYYSGLAFSLYFIFRIFTIKSYKKILLLFLILFITFCLVSVQLLPFLEFANKIVRGIERYENIGALPYQNLITFFIPDFFGNPTMDNFWNGGNYTETCGYLGIFPLFLILFSIIFRRDKFNLFFTFLLIFSLLLLLKTQLYEIFYYILPFFDRFRGVNRFLYLYTFSASVLSALGLDFILNKEKDKNLKFTFWTIFIGIAFFLIVSFLWQNIQIKREINFLKLYDFEKRNIWTFLGFVLTSMLLLIFHFKQLINLKIFKILVISSIIIDLFSFGMKYNPITSAKLAFPKTKSLKFLENDKELFRITRFKRQGILLTNIGMVYNIFDVQGYDPLILREYGDFLNLIQYQEGSLKLNYVNDILDESSLGSKLIDFLNVKYILTLSKIKNKNFELIFNRPEEIKIYKNRGCLPRSFIVYKAKIIKDKRKILEELKSEDFNPRECVILEEKIEHQSTRAEDGGQKTEDRIQNLASSIQLSVPRIIKYSPNEVIIEANLDKRGFLVLSDTYYPGWEVYVDGRKDKIYEANYCFRAVALGKGKHKVKFIYNPLSFRIGLYVSLTTLLLILSFLTYALLKGRRK